MRVAFIGVSHWHTSHYLEPLIDNADVTLVGMADPDEGIARATADRTGAAAFVDYRVMCEQTRPDVVFALGRHIDMAAEAEYLIEAGLPFAMEKPCGVTVAEIERIAHLAKAKSSFAAIPFTYRNSRFRELIAEHCGDREMNYGLFRQIPGPVSRYENWDVRWNLDRKQAGGGCTLNLSIHFFDLVRVLAPSAPWEVTGATMSSDLAGCGVEDFSATVLEGGGRRATVETGYFYPGKGGETILSVCVGEDYFRWDGRRGEVTVTHADRPEETHSAGASQSAYYGPFALDTVRRVAKGEMPEAGLDDMVAAARLAERAYRLAGYADSMSGR